MSAPDLALSATAEPEDGIAISLASVPPRLRTHPSYAKRSTFRIDGHAVADGSEVWDSPYLRKYDHSGTYRPVTVEEWDPDPEWSAWVNTHPVDAEEPRPAWDPWDHLEDGEELDVDGEKCGQSDLLPLEFVTEECAPTAGDLEWYRADLELRRAATPLYDLSPEVITESAKHPFSTLTCESCGDQSEVRLDHCGRALCLPCWRKQGARAFPEVGRTLVAFLKLADPRYPLPELCERPGHAHDDRRPDLRTVGEWVRGLGVRPIVRFVTLTVRSGPVLAERIRVLLSSYGRLRASQFWRARALGAISRLEVTWSPSEGWHPHLHLAVVGRFIPDRPAGALEEPRLERRPRLLKRAPSLDRLPDYYRYQFPDGAPSFLREFVPESNLQDEWIHATRGEGSIVDVRTADMREDPLKFAAELAKYIAKPFANAPDNSRLEMKDWPEAIRLELAEFVHGTTRVRWYCAAHSTLDRPATRRRAPWEVLPGCPPDRSRCVTEDGREGEYRIEAVGARRLLFYGVLRSIHAETRDDGALDSDLCRCGKCGKGKLLAPWEVARRLLSGWTLPAGALPPGALPLIHAHKSAARRWRTRTFNGSPGWGGTSGEGAEGPPDGAWAPGSWASRMEYGE